MMLNFDQSDQLQVKGLTAQVKTQPGFQDVDNDMVDQAWSLAKSQADMQGIDQDDPAYWDSITTQTKQDLGLQMPDTPKNGKPMNTMQRNTNMKTANPNAPGLVANPQEVNNIVERRVREIQGSGAFSATPENAGVWKPGKTGPEINDEAKKRLDLMKAHGFGADL
jgi:hypothetical protein